MVRRSRRSVAEEEEDPNAAHELDEGRRRNKGKGAAQSSSQLSQEPGEDDGDDSGIEVLDSSDDEEANARVLADAQAAAAAAGAALFHEMDVSCLEAPQDDQEPQPTDFRPVIDTLRAQLKLLTKAAKKYEPPHRGYKQGKTERERRRRIRPDDWIQSDDEDDDEDGRFLSNETITWNERERATDRREAERHCRPKCFFFLIVFFAPFFLS